MVLEPVCIPDGSGWSRGQSSERPEGTMGMCSRGEQGVPYSCLQPVPMTHQHCSRTPHPVTPNPEHPASLIHGPQRGGKHLVQGLFALLQNPQAPGPLNKRAPSWPKPALPAGRSTALCPGPPLSQTRVPHRMGSVTGRIQNSHVVLHSTRNDLPKAQYPGLKHVCPCPSH